MDGRKGGVKMGADTRYYVQVIKPTYEWVEIIALTSEEAKEKARQLPDVDGVRDVKHWSYFEEVGGC